MTKKIQTAHFQASIQNDLYQDVYTSKCHNTRWVDYTDTHLVLIGFV